MDISRVINWWIQLPRDATTRVMAGVFSVNAQCVTLLNHKAAGRVDPAFAAALDTVEPMVDHITRFSLAGIGAMAGPARPPAARGRRIPRPRRARGGRRPARTRR